MQLLRDHRHLTGWVTLTDGVYTAEAKILPKPRPEGMWGGRVSRLYVGDVFRYDGAVRMDRAPKNVVRSFVEYCDAL